MAITCTECLPFAPPRALSAQTSTDSVRHDERAVRKRALRYHVPPVPQLAITDRNDRAIAALRIAIGLLFLIFAEYKLFGAKFTRGGGFEYWINRFLADGAYPFMKPLLRGLVLPHARFFAWL